ncbi:MAG TPA: MarC family protein [Rectinemataceae bacterium]
MDKSFVSTTLLLVLVTDPLGNIPLFLAALKGVDPKRRPRIILRECGIAFVILVVFLVFGSAFLNALHLSDETLRIAGGVILFLIALNMVFPGTGGKLVEEGGGTGSEPFIVPVAVPLIAGPSAMTTVMLLGNSDPEKIPLWMGSIFIAIVITTIVFFSSGRLKDWLGEKALNAVEKLMGLVLTAVAVEMLLGGLAAYISMVRG